MDGKYSSIIAVPLLKNNIRSRILPDPSGFLWKREFFGAASSQCREIGYNERKAGASVPEAVPEPAIQETCKGVAAMNSSCKLAAFDLDGTLNRTELFAVEALQDTQRELGFPVQSAETLISLFGAPASEYIPLILPGADEETVARYRRIVPEKEKQYIHQAKAYDGAAEMLDALHAAGYTTAVCSNSSNRYISLVLRSIGLFEKIDLIQPLEQGMDWKGESLKHLLEKTAPQSAVMIGDTRYDFEAAAFNGIPFIGCLYGFRPHEIAGLPHLVERPADLTEAVLRLSSLA